jgi:hypothetical protein
MELVGCCRLHRTAEEAWGKAGGSRSMAGDQICSVDEVLPARLISGISGAGAMAKLGNGEAVGSFRTRAGCSRMAVSVCVLSRILTHV